MRWICGAVVVALCTPGTAMASSLPLGFEPNAGQADPSVRYLGRTGDGAAFLTGSGAVLRLGRGEAVRLRPVGAREDASVTAAGRMPGVVNRLHGDDPSKWLTGLPLYRRVRQHELYPGIDLAFHFRRGALEYDWIVAPGARPSAIRLAVDGGGKLRLTRRGDLLVRTRKGVLRQRRPVAYQRVAGRRRPVAVRFVLRGARRIGFALGRYDRTRPLVVDPVVTFSTYVGGRRDDGIADVATDGAGNTYLSGTTHSLDFPTASAYDAGCGTDAEKSCNPYVYYENPESTPDAFVVKLSPAGELVYATYLGGTQNDWGHNLAVDGQGRAVLFGATVSADFPTTAGSFRPTRACVSLSPCEQLFVTRLSASGSALDWSTYFGGSSDDAATDVAVDGQGHVYLTGLTRSTYFPVTPGAVSVPNRGPGGYAYSDVYVTKLRSDGTGLVYSGVFGGEYVDHGASIAVNGAGEAVIAGSTSSVQFPTTEGALNSVCDGPPPPQSSCDSDAFVTRISADGSAIKQSTLLGGRAYDYAAGVVLDAQDRPIVAGRTGSDNFPRAHVLDDKREPENAFVTRLAADLSAVDYTGLVSGDVNPSGVALAPDGGAYLAGLTSGGQLPVRDAVQPAPGSKACHADGYSACREGFAMRIAPDGNEIRWATYVGGGAEDHVNGLAATGNGVVVAGQTWSPDLPTRSPIDAAIGDGTCRLASCRADGFVTRIDEAPTSGSPYDGFDRRRRLNSMSGFEHGDSSRAAGATEWFEWTAPANRTVAFDTTGSAIDTTLTVYRGTAPGALTQVAANDDHDGTTASRAVWKAVRGRTYKIALGAKGGGGRYVLEWLGARPFNDDFADAQAISGATGEAAGNTVYATLEPGEPGLSEHRSTTWYSWTAPHSGVFAFTTEGSDATNYIDLHRGDALALLEGVPQIDHDTSDAVVRAVEGVTYRVRVAGGSELGDVELAWRAVPKPANDDLLAAQVLTGASGSVEGETWAATRELQESADAPGRSVWYRWTAPASGVYEFDTDAAWGASLAVYTGTAYGNLTRVDPRPGGYPYRFGTEAGRTYLLSVEAGSPFKLTWGTSTSPANDLFVNAAPLAPAGGQVTAHARRATFEPGEPVGSSTTWYTWTAPANGPVSFAVLDDHAGSIAIFTGSAVDALTLVGETSGWSGPAHVEFTAVAGSVYRVQVREYERLHIAWDFGAPANDAIAAAQVLTGSSGSVTGSVAHATGQPGQETDGETVKSVWYSWTAPASGATTLSMGGSDTGPLLVDVYTGSAPAFTQVASDYDGELSFNATSGTTYRFRVSGSWVPRLMTLPFQLSWNKAGTETVPPEVELQRPIAGERLRGGWELTAYAYDRSRIAKVEFLVNGVLLGEATHRNPPTFAYYYWDSRKGPDGPAELVARATDNFGNVSTSVPVTLVVDNTLPVTSIVSGPSGTTSSRTATFQFAAGEEAEYWCRIDDDWWFRCAQQLVVENLEDGPHALEVRANDLVGNQDVMPARRTWTVVGEEADPAPEPEPEPEPDPELPPEETPDPPSDGGGGGALGGGSDGSPPTEVGGGGGGAFTPLPADGGTIVSRSEDGKLGLSATVLTGRLTAATLRRGLPVRLSCSAGCRATARLALSKAQARKVRLKPGTIARGTKRLFAGDRVTVRLRPSRRVAAALARRRGVRVRLIVDAVTPDGTKATIRRTLVVR